jgi:hypothetical protein
LEPKPAESSSSPSSSSAAFLRTLVEHADSNCAAQRGMGAPLAQLRKVKGDGIKLYK